MDGVTIPPIGKRFLLMTDLWGAGPMGSFGTLIEITPIYVSRHRKYMIDYTMLVGQPCYVCASQTTKHGERCCGKLQFHHKRHLSCDLEDFSKKWK